jgi:TusA-related sulfurtransferase|tara:strand:+ start:301 stop:531 length:231 start_codon:yes stop_codon:yes gene_type:complete
MIKKTKLINLMGLRCPLPVLKIAKKIKEVRKGDIIKVKVDDPKAENDINELNKQIKITIIKKVKHNDFMLFEIEKN